MRGSASRDKSCKATRIASSHTPYNENGSLLQRPNLDHRVPTTGRQVPIHEAEFLGGRRVPVELQRRVLHRRPVVHLDAVLPGGGDYFARVELERSDGVVVPQRIGDGARSEIPDLRARESSVCRLDVIFSAHPCSHPDGPVKTSADEVVLVELEASDGTGVTDQGPVRLTSPHCGGEERDFVSLRERVFDGKEREAHCPTCGRNRPWSRSRARSPRT